MSTESTAPSTPLEHSWMLQSTRGKLNLDLVVQFVLLQVSKNTKLIPGQLWTKPVTTAGFSKDREVKIRTIRM